MRMGRISGTLVLAVAITACSSSGKAAETTIVSTTCGAGTHLDGHVCTVDATTTDATEPPATEPEIATTEATPPSTEPEPTTEATDPAPTTEAAPVCSSAYHLDESNQCVLTTAATNATVPVIEVAPEVIAATLQEPLKAWMLEPSGPGFDAVAAAVGSLDAAGDFPATTNVFGATESTNQYFDVLSAYPGADWMVYDAADSLRSFMPDLPFVLSDGNWTVGTDVPAGRYRTVGGVDGCYWETLDSAGEINDNNFVTAAPQVLMTVRQSDYAVNSEDCGPWVKIG